MAKNGSVKIGNTEMYYSSFGSGSKNAVDLTAKNLYKIMKYRDKEYMLYLLNNY